MPRTAEQNEALRAATREAVQSAAVRIFARYGFAAANMRQIAAEAGLSAGSIYRHYATKHELFDELLSQAVAGLSATAAGLAGPGRPVHLIREFTAGFLADVAGQEGAAEFFMVVNQGFTTDTPPGTTARLVEAHRELWGTFAALVRRGQATGEFIAGDPERMTACYFATLTGITTMWLAMHDALAMPDVDMVLRTLTGGNTDD